MKEIFNTIHYTFYKIDIQLSSVIRRMSPFRLVSRLPFLRKRYEELGIDNIDKEVDKAFSNPELGYSMMTAGGTLWALLGCFIASLLGALGCIIFKLDLDMNAWAGGFILSTLMTYLLVFRNDIYLEYFKKYAELTGIELVGHYLITLLFVVLTIVTFITWLYVL